MPDDADSRSRRPRRGGAPRGGQRLEVEVVGSGARFGSAASLAAWLRRVAPARARGAVTVALVSDARMRALNRRFRRTDRLTDVLSFPASTARGPASRRRPLKASSRPTGLGVGRRAASSVHPAEAGGVRSLGDIVIAAGRARRQARVARHRFADELRLLALHGLLHLLGYDHERDGGRMARAERALRRKGGLEAGLIERIDRSHRRPGRRAE